MIPAEGNTVAVDAPRPEVDRSDGLKAPGGSVPGVFLMINSLETGGSNRARF